MEVDGRTQAILNNMHVLPLLPLLPAPPDPALHAMQGVRSVTVQPRGTGRGGCFGPARLPQQPGAWGAPCQQEAGGWPVGEPVWLGGWVAAGQPATQPTQPFSCLAEPQGMLPCTHLPTAVGHSNRRRWWHQQGRRLSGAGASHRPACGHLSWPEEEVGRHTVCYSVPTLSASAQCMKCMTRRKRSRFPGVQLTSAGSNRPQGWPGTPPRQSTAQ